MPVTHVACAKTLPHRLISSGLQDGHTYERRAIVEWLTKSGLNPLTNTELSSKKLVPNLQLRQVIKENFPNRLAALRGGYH